MSALYSSADGGGKQNGEDRRKLESAEREYLHALCLTHYPALRRYVYHLGFRGEGVEDWIQETFLVAIRHIEVLKAHENPGAYLTQILRNVIGHALRRMQYAARIAEQLRAEELTEPSGYGDELDPEILYSGLVSDEELRLLLRFYLEGWSQKDLARELGIDIEACSKRIQRAKAHLKAAMERNGLR